MNVLIMYSCSIAVSWAQSFDFFRFFSCDHLVDNLSLLIYFFLYPYLYCAMCILFINGVLSSNLIIKQEKGREQGGEDAHGVDGAQEVSQLQVGGFLWCD